MHQNYDKYNMRARRVFEESRATGLNISKSSTIHLISGVSDSSRINRHSKSAMLRIPQNHKEPLLQNHNNLIAEATLEPKWHTDKIQAPFTTFGNVIIKFNIK